jgi:hypothetical protein
MMAIEDHRPNETQDFVTVVFEASIGNDLTRACSAWCEILPDHKFRVVHWTYGYGSLEGTKGMTDGTLERVVEALSELLGSEYEEVSA